MGFWKFFPFLALSSIWILCLASSLQAAPPKSAMKSSLDKSTLSEDEKRLLTTLMQNFYKPLKTKNLEQVKQVLKDSSYEHKKLAMDDISTAEKLLRRLILLSSSATQKRSCKTATCVTHRLAGLLNRSGGMLKSNFVPTNVGANTYGRRRRDLQD